MSEVEPRDASPAGRCCKQRSLARLVLPLTLLAALAVVIWARFTPQGQGVLARFLPGDQPGQGAVDAGPEAVAAEQRAAAALEQQGVIVIASPPDCSTTFPPMLGTPRASKVTQALAPNSAVMRSMLPAQASLARVTR